jgi:hypothetical protein
VQNKAPAGTNWQGKGRGEEVHSASMPLQLLLKVTMLCNSAFDHHNSSYEAGQPVLLLKYTAAAAATASAVPVAS